jgi:hypothetical protein
MPKLYTFGDSCTYGYSFLPDEDLRKRSIWPTKLAKALGYELVECSIPGSSNWRMARLIASTSFEPDSLIITAFSTHCRFEFGVSPDHVTPPVFVDNGLPVIGDLLEIDDKLITKRFFANLDKRTSDIDAKLFAVLAFSEFFNKEWFSKMQGVCFNSIQHTLKNNNWLVFNAWTKPFEENDFWLKHANVKNYVLGLHGVMSEQVADTIGNDLTYWSDEQHTAVANILLNEYRKLYG